MLEVWAFIDRFKDVLFPPPSLNTTQPEAAVSSSGGALDAADAVAWPFGAPPTAEALAAALTCPIAAEVRTAHRTALSRCRAVGARAYA